MATIVLDPGHGGSRQIGRSGPIGAVGPGGTAEKTLTLAIAIRVARRLRASGHRVILTREDDRNVSLADRSALARESGADLFVSIHFRGGKSACRQGTETRCHDDAEPVSWEFAEAVQRAVSRATGLHDLGTKATRATLLQPDRFTGGTAACQIGISALTDAHEERRLAQRSYLDTVAGALVSGTEIFLGRVAASTRHGKRVDPHRPDAFAAAALPATCAATPLQAGFERRTAPTPAGRPPKLWREPFMQERARVFAELKAAGFGDAARFLGECRKHGLSASHRDGSAGCAAEALPARFLPTGSGRARAVCKIVAGGRDHRGRTGTWSGTGFLVGPNLLLTNHHVLNSADVAAGAECRFDFEETASGDFGPMTIYRLDPDRLFLTSPARKGLDYTFVWIHGDAHRRYGSIPMERAAFTVSPGERAHVIHHSQGGPKRVSLGDNEIVANLPALIHYLSDSVRGGSGSPVFDNAWRLVGLHHAERENRAGLTDTHGRRPAMVNEATKIAAIALDLETKLSDAAHCGPAAAVLKRIAGVDSLSGYFGALGRTTPANSRGVERIRNIYNGSASDIDVGFLNIERFDRKTADRLDQVAAYIADLNLDVWVLGRASQLAPRRIVEILNTRFGQDFAMAFSEPAVPSRKRSTAVIWNKNTVRGTRQDWPSDIDAAFRSGRRAARGTKSSPDGYPGLFHFSALDRDIGGPAAFEVYVVPLYASGSVDRARWRRDTAPLLSWAIDRMIVTHGRESEFLLAGELDAGTIATGIPAIPEDHRVVVSDSNGSGGSLAFLKRQNARFDRLFLSPNLRYAPGPEKGIAYSGDRTPLEEGRRLTGHAPILARLSLEASTDTAPPPDRTSKKHLPADLTRLLSPSPGGTISVPSSVTGPIDGRPIVLGQRSLDAILAELSRHYRDRPDDVARALARMMEKRVGRRE
ncbi:MAG: N-acetylmuramoyl-L-alanine amidase [Pseudomonadota bacterium]